MVEGEGEHVDLVVEAEQLQELDGLEGAAAGEGDHDQLVGQVDVLFVGDKAKKARLEVDVVRGILQLKMGVVFSHMANLSSTQ